MSRAVPPPACRMSGWKRATKGTFEMNWLMMTLVPRIAGTAVTPVTPAKRLEKAGLPDGSHQDKHRGKKDECAPVDGPEYRKPLR